MTAGMTSGAAAAASEQHKRIANDLGWVCVSCLSRHMATGAEKHIPLLSIWPLGLPSVLRCNFVQKE